MAQNQISISKNIFPLLDISTSYKQAFLSHYHNIDWSDVIKTSQMRINSMKIELDSFMQFVDYYYKFVD